MNPPPELPPRKMCPVCGRSVLLAEYGKHWYCKACRREAERRYAKSRQHGRGIITHPTPMTEPVEPIECPKCKVLVDPLDFGSQWYCKVCSREAAKRRYQKRIASRQLPAPSTES
jgi:ribosomal protein S27AE